MLLAISLLGGITQLVRVHRVWQVREDPHTALQFLLGHPPADLTPSRQDLASDGEGRTATGVAYSFPLGRSLPPELGAVSLEASVTADGANGSWIYVDAEVSWRARRPVAESVGPLDRVLTVSEFRDTKPDKVLRHRVITDQAIVGPIVKAFDELPVAIPTSGGCTADFGTSLSYRIAFSRSASAPPDLVATVGTFCREGTSVDLHGRPSLALERGTPRHWRRTRSTGTETNSRKSLA